MAVSSFFYEKNKDTRQIRGQRYNSAGVAVGDDFLVADEDGAEISAQLLDDSRVALVYRIIRSRNLQMAVVKAELSTPVAGPSTPICGGNDTVTGGENEDVPDPERSQLRPAKSSGGT
ncbi:hypothetical protein [Roseobacter sinensis]|uniref:Uncharacterized protein n=1 Tax=Roseobacter sinensis TaxID=2931391 RepID=A0ABT3BIR1_9RHOB|nr:hypothetical protein [Roseobacter sp. WL0113]MCV3273437.1 hypothetical protein [Roseobacter sp. WL0113]